jgi:hypothetical protein
MKFRRANEIRSIVGAWGAKPTQELEDGVLTFSMGLLGGLAYATGPSYTQLRCSIFLDFDVDLDEANDWIDSNDDPPIGGLNVFRAKDLDAYPHKRQPDELTLRFVFTEPFEHAEIPRAADISRDLAHRWLWRHVSIPDGADRALAQTTFEDGVASTHMFEWFSDQAKLGARFTDRMAELNDFPPSRSGERVQVALAEIRDIRQLELGRVRAVPPSKPIRELAEDIRAFPQFLLPTVPPPAPKNDA